MHPRRSVLVMHGDHQQVGVRRTLSTHYDILGVRGSEAAMRRLATGTVDVLLADGTVAGRDFLERVERNAPNGLPVVLADSIAINSLMDVLRDDAFSLTIEKPETPERVLQELWSILFPRLAGRQGAVDLAAKIHFPKNQSLQLTVLDISNRGFSFHLNSAQHLARFLPGTRLQAVQLHRGSEHLGSFAAVVRSVSPLSPHETNGGGVAKFKVGAEFLNSRRPEPEGATETIADPLRIGVFLRGASRRGGFTAQLADTETSAVHFQKAVVDRNNRILLLATNSLGSQFGLGDIVQCSFGLGGQSFTFLSAVLGFERAGMLLGFPRSVRAIRRRENNRISLNDGHPIQVEFASLAGETVRRTAIDLSAWGVAVAISYTHEVLPVGTYLDRIHLRFPDGASIVTRGRVRSLVPLRQEHPYLELPFKCGIQFEALSLTESVRIANAIFRLGDDSVRDSEGLSFHDVWNLLQETGFLYAEKLDRLKPSLPQVQHTLETLLSRPNRIFKTLVYRRRQSLQGHLSVFRAYRRTWTIQHLAARKTRDAQLAARMLNLGVVEYFDQIPQLEWVRVYFRADNHWPARIFGTFARRLRDPTRSEMRRLNYLVAPSAESSPDSNYKVRKATSRDLARIEAYFVKRGRLINLDADDLYGAVLPLKELSREYAQLGLRREREILVVAGPGGELLGFVLLEISSPGLNLSELTNTFQIYTVDGNPDVKQALIHAARRRYGVENRPDCIALADDSDLLDFEAAGFVKTKVYNCWTAHRSLLHKYYEFIDHELIINLSRQEPSRSEAVSR